MLLKIPEVIKNMELNLDKLSIFDKKKFDDKKVIEYEVGVIGEIELSNNERIILRLPPKLAVEENLPEEGLAMDEEVAFAKARMTISKEEEEKLDEDEGIEEDEEELEKMDCMTRQIYDTKERRFDDRKRNLTDLKECARVTLPKPLITKHEALIEMRRGMNGKSYKEYRQEVCKKKGNLTQEEKEGLASLKKRMRAEEIIVMKTDKSGEMSTQRRIQRLTGKQ